MKHIQLVENDSELSTVTYPYVGLSEESNKLSYVNKKFTLVYEDDFKTLNEEVWTKVKQGTSSWNKNKCTDDSLFEFTDDGLRLYAKLNDGLDPSSSEKYVTAGITAKSKKTFVKGKFEVVAKMHNCQGTWHAIWTGGQNNDYNKGPYIEVDMTECLNDNTFTYQTIHSTEIWKTKKGGLQVKTTIDPTAWNTYTLEFDDESVRIFTNGALTHEYKNPNDGTYLFAKEDNPMYLIIDAQIDGTWAGTPDDTKLPSWIEVKSLKMYSME